MEVSAGATEQCGHKLAFAVIKLCASETVESEIVQIVDLFDQPQSYTFFLTHFPFFSFQSINFWQIFRSCSSYFFLSSHFSRFSWKTFHQISAWARPPLLEGRITQILQHCLNASCYAHYNVFIWESRQSSGPNSAENTDDIEKRLIQKLLESEFLTNKFMGACFYLPQAWSKAVFQDWLFLSIWLCFNWFSRLNAAANIDIIKKSFKQQLFKILLPTKKSQDACLYLPQG